MIKNVSSHDIDHVIAFGPARSPGESSINIVVKDSSGNVLPEPLSSRKLHGRAPGQPPLGGSVFNSRQALRPGETTKEEKDLSERFDMEKPGIYTIQAQDRDLLTGVTVFSNVLTINVTP